MSFLLLGPLCFLLSLLEPPPAEEPRIEVMASAADALRRVVEQSRPSILGVGEVHQTVGKQKIKSALARFGGELLPLLAPVSSDLVLETWLVTGQCGEPEKQVVTDVEKTTERPVATEDEIVTLAKAAKAAGVAPHALEIDCHDYRTISEGGDVDYVKLLNLTRDRLQQAIARALAAPRRPGRPLTLVYGGALHNDANPASGDELYSYGRGAYAASGGRYVELDLYVPEFLRGTEIAKREAWLKNVKQRAGQVLLVRRSPASWAIVFPPSQARAGAKRR